MRPLTDWLLAGLTLLLPLTAVAAPVGYAVGFDTLYRVDVANGQAVPVGPIGYSDVEGLAFAPDGTLYGVADAGVSSGSGLSDLLIRINTSTGAGSLVAPLSALAGIGPGGNLDYGLAATCDARLWLSSDTTGQLWEINPGNGTTRLVGVMGQPISGLAARGNDLVGVSIGSTPALYRIDRQTAAATLAGPLNAGGIVDDAGLDYDAAGLLWASLDPEPAVIGASRIARIDPATGQATISGNVSVGAVGMEGLAIAAPGGCTATGTLDAFPQPVPGPGLPALALLILGAGGLAARRLKSAA